VIRPAAPHCYGETQAVGIVAEGFKSCAMQLTLRIRVKSGEFTAGRASCSSPFECSYLLKLNRRARRLLSRHTVHAVVQVVRLPAPGAIPTRERVAVVRGR
jgi:hypothetical protein